MSIELSPAYGRDYKSQKEVMADWRAGKDFVIQSYPNTGRYCSIRDVESGTIKGSVAIRYKRMTQVMVVK